MLKKLFLILLFLMNTNSFANDTEKKTVKVIIPYSSASSVGQFFRVFQDYAVKKNILAIADFKPGASTMVGMNYAANGMHDTENTVMLTVFSDLASKHPARTFKEDSFIPISSLVSVKVYVVANNNIPVNSLSELAESLKKDPSQFSWAIPNPQFETDLKRFASKIGVNYDKLVVTRFNGPGGAQSPVMISGGHIDLGIYTATSTSQVVALAKEKKLKIIGVYRHGDLPGYETMEYYTPWETTDGYGLFLLHGASEKMVEFWEDFSRDFLNDPEVQKTLDHLNLRLLKPGRKSIEKILDIINERRLSLTDRQQEIFGLIRVRGLSNKQISKQLNISESAVKLHVGNILKKYGLRSRTQLATYHDVYTDG